MREGRVSRRLAAILAADVVGYSRLVGQNEEGTITRLNTLRTEVLDPGIARHNGRMVKIRGRRNRYAVHTPFARVERAFGLRPHGPRKVESALGTGYLGRHTRGRTQPGTQCGLRVGDGSDGRGKEFCGRPRSGDRVQHQGGRDGRTLSRQPLVHGY